MSRIPASYRRRVIRRAESKCEYCLLSQEFQEATFHIDHVLPRQDGGQTNFNNLALACVSCSLRKGARRSASDPESSRIVRLFNPRKDKWDQHFSVDEVIISGNTAIGRATVEALQMNRPSILRIREEIDGS